MKNKWMKIIGIYAIAFGVYAFTTHTVDGVYDRLKVVDIRLDSAYNQIRTVQDNTESTVVISSQFGRGSGFYLTEDYVITNAHVVSSNMFGKSLNSTYVFTNHFGVPVKGELVAVNVDLDIAIIKAGRKGNPVLTYNTKTVVVDDFIYSIGSNPNNLKAIKTGYVLQKANDLLPQTFITDSRIEPGFSGGGTFDKHNILVGVNVAGMHNYKNQMSFIIEWTNVKKWVVKEIIKHKAEVVND